MTLAAVYGPGEVKLQKLLTDCATIGVTYKPKTGVTSMYLISEILIVLGYIFQK